MKITNTTREGSKASVEMNIARDTLEQAKIKVYAKAKKNIMLPGFRKGHAPRKMVEAMYGEDVFLEDAIEEIFPEVFECLTESLRRPGDDRTGRGRQLAGWKICRRRPI